MRSIILLAVALSWAVAPLPARAQAGTRTAHNALYLEGLGNAGLYSVNYDRRVGDVLALRAGVGAWTADDLFLGDEAESSVLAVPVTVSWLPGASGRGPELGGGVLLGRRDREGAFGEDDTSSSFVSLTGIAGYRWQPLDGGMVVRIGFTPFYGLGDEDEAYPDKGFIPSAGISIGYAF